MTITTIKLKKETKERLEKLRESKRESYDDIIKKILYTLNITRENPTKAKMFLERIDEIRTRVKEEEKYNKEELKKLKLENKKNKNKEI